MNNCLNKNKNKNKKKQPTFNNDCKYNKKKERKKNVKKFEPVKYPTNNKHES